MLISKLKQRYKDKKEYIVLNAKTMVKQDIIQEKSNMSVLMSKLKDITNTPKAYESLSEEEVCVMLCGDAKIDTEKKTIKVVNLKSERALAELANII